MTNNDKNTSTHKRFCKVCGCYRSVVSKKKLVDFRVVGESLTCAFCGSNLDEAAVEKPKSALAGLFNDTPQESSQGVSSLFVDTTSDSAHIKKEISSSTSNVPKKESIVFLDSDKAARFCRDCVFFMYHPYKSYCCKHDKDVSPSDDCKDFSSR